MNTVDPALALTDAAHFHVRMKLWNESSSGTFIKLNTQAIILTSGSGTFTGASQTPASADAAVQQGTHTTAMLMPPL